MKEIPQYLYAEITNPPDKYLDIIGDIKSIVLFGLICGDGELLYLEIRYIDFEEGVVHGDSICWSLEEAYKLALKWYGIEKEDWRTLSNDEFHRIDASIK